MVHQNRLEKSQTTEKEATNEKPKLKIKYCTVDLLVENDRVIPNFNFQSLGHYPASSQVPHPTYAEAV